MSDEKCEAQRETYPSQLNEMGKRLVNAIDSLNRLKCDLGGEETEEPAVPSPDKIEATAFYEVYPSIIERPDNHAKAVAGLTEQIRKILI